MDHIPHSMEMQMRMVGHMTNNTEHQQFSVSNERMGLAEQVSSTPGFDTLMIPINSVGPGGSSGSSVGLSHKGMPNQLSHENTSTLNNVAGQNASLPVKRKAEMGPVVNTSNSLPNKLPAQMGANANLHRFLQASAPQRRPGFAQPYLGSPGLQAQPALNKKVASTESMPNKPPSQRGRPPKKQSTQIEPASKSRPESSEAVRSKMRENLAAALALPSPKQDNVSNSEKDQSDATVTQQIAMTTQASQSNSTINDNSSGLGSQEMLKELGAVSTMTDSQVLPTDIPHNASGIDGGNGFPEFQYSSIFPDVDVQFTDSFFAKDDLLQGNGLAWAFDFDMQKRELEEAQNAAAEKTKLVKEEANTNGHELKEDLPNLTPEDLAFKIEAELFKLFGGVNKKYKEKGRSLLFNLKDQTNPELRERVMSGELPPKRLCSMSAEELASKALSEWRMSKAEKLAQMVVLPDTDGDMRRLVKKTHKGEYQVEFERDDGIADEVSGGTSMVTRLQPKKKTESHSASKASLKDEENQKNASENEFPGNLVIPTDGTDLMQGMMVDEMKDTESLPPIVSLDEFMESLNSEPPFENLSGDGLQKTSEAGEERPNVMNNSKASDRTSGSPKDASSKKADVKKPGIDMVVKASQSPKQNAFSNITSVAENIWEGALQLNISSSVTVRGQFQSGEKTSTKEWPASLEIKGRVRVEAFEKFLQELPMSRTRAVMVLHIDLKDKSSEREGRDFSEAVESYSADERLGYAEPARGVELYLCPPTSRMSEMLKKHLPKHCVTNISSSSSINGLLIGVVVWRRAHISTNSSPNSSSHNKHTSMKKQHYSSNRLQNSSLNNMSKPMSQPQPQPDDDDDDDDIPPGFGPGVAVKKDDDDLPEFNFSSHINHHQPQPFGRPNLVPQHQQEVPLGQVRELIKKYGQIGTGVSSDKSLGIEPWNDDDDDIPEWRPEVPVPVRGVPPSGGKWAQVQGRRWGPY